MIVKYEKCQPYESFLQSHQTTLESKEVGRRAWDWGSLLSFRGC